MCPTPDREIPRSRGASTAEPKRPGAAAGGSSLPARRGRVLRHWLAAAAVAAAAPAAAEPVDVRYVATLGGLRLGEMRIQGQVTAKTYALQATGRYGALGYRGTFTAQARGAIKAAEPSPAQYSYENDRGALRAVSISFDGGTVSRTELTRATPVADKPGEGALGADDLANVVDPLSVLAAIVANQRAGSPCRDDARVFTGVDRIDMRLAPAAAPDPRTTVCRLQYAVVAGPAAKTHRTMTDVTLSFDRNAAPSDALPSSIALQTMLGRVQIVRADPSAE